MEYLENIPIEKMIKDYKKFLDQVKNSNHRRVLVVCHGGTITLITEMICNIVLMSNATVVPYEY